LVYSCDHACPVTHVAHTVREMMITGVAVREVMITGVAVREVELSMMLMGHCGQGSGQGMEVVEGDCTGAVEELERECTASGLG
jgi:hypothetical protein